MTYTARLTPTGRCADPYYDIMDISQWARTKDPTLNSKSTNLKKTPFLGGHFFWVGRPVNFFEISTPCFVKSSFWDLLDLYEEVDRPLKCRLFRISAHGLAPKTLPWTVNRHFRKNHHFWVATFFGSAGWSIFLKFRPPVSSKVASRTS